VEFVGDSGPGAVIDMYLPQPGQHTGRRILKIEDIPGDRFTDAAGSAGVPWAAYLGMEKKDGLWEIVRPELLTDRWMSRFARTRRIGAARLTPVKVALNTSARAALATQGTLASWARGGGATTAAKLSTNPDAAGNTEEVEVEYEPPGRNDNTPRNPPPEDDAGGTFAGSIIGYQDGVIRIPTEGWGDLATETEVDVEAPPEPALFLIQVLGISSFLGDYGLGRTVKTFTLLPGEVTNIHTRTWRATEESKAQASSIIDSYDESAQERFVETVLSETTDTASREKSENWHVEAEASASIGFASAGVSGGGGGEYSSSTEEFARSLDEAVREHAAESSSHRENTVTSSSESSVSTEDEEVVERSIRNINVSRVLNFTFRELNQEFITKTHLKEVRVAFTNGQAGSWREEPISNLRRLVEEFIQPQFVDEVCSDIIGTIAIVRDVHEAPIPVLEQVRLNACGTDFQVRDAQPGKDCRYPAPRADGSFYYRFKRGPLAQDPAAQHPVDGVVLSERTIVMATDSVVVEALLGVNTALDAYSENLQLEAVREKQLANDREELALRIVRGGKTAEADLYQRVFGTCCTTADADVEEPVPA
jgi:hypothetical protein